MNNWIKRIVAALFVVTQFLVIPEVSASSLENIQNKKSSVEQEVTQLQSQVSNSLEEVSEISIALDELTKEIEEHKVTIDETEEDIVEQEVLVEERYEYTASQLKAMQKNEVNQNIVIGLLQTESFSELINKIYTVARLTGASEDHLVEAQAEQEKLDDLRDKLLVHQEDLDTKQAETVKQKEVLDTKLTELKTNLANSESTLENLNAEEQEVIAKAQAEEEARQAREAERQAAVVVSNKTVSTSTATSSSNSSNSSNSNSSNHLKQTNTTTQASNSKESNKKESNKKESNKENTSSNEQQTTQSSSAGEWMNFQATGYSTQQPGLSTHTATGIDLRVNSRVIAVDPSIIPLGSLVEVQGMGVYVAGDTGGAINGRIIDIHFSSVSQALSWGRRSVNVRVIN